MLLTDNSSQKTYFLLKYMKHYFVRLLLTMSVRDRRLGDHGTRMCSPHQTVTLSPFLLPTILSQSAVSVDIGCKTLNLERFYTRFLHFSTFLPMIPLMFVSEDETASGPVQE